MSNDSNTVKAVRRVLKHISKISMDVVNDMPAACSGDRIEELAQEIYQRFEVDLPEDYREFLAVANGFEFDGSLIFANDAGEAESPAPNDDDEYRIPGVVAINLHYDGHDVLEEYLVMGRSDLDIYVYDPGSEEYLALEEGSYDEVESFESFGDLFAFAFEEDDIDEEDDE